MFLNIIKKIYYSLRVVKRYTLEEWSQEIVNNLCARGATIGTNVDTINAAINTGR